MDLCLSSAFLRQWVRYPILHECELTNRCRKQLRNILPLPSQGGVSLYFWTFFTVPKTWAKEKCVAGEWKRQHWAGQGYLLWFFSFSLLSHNCPSSVGTNSAGKAGSAAVSFEAWQQCCLVGQKTILLQGRMFCWPHQITLRLSYFLKWVFIGWFWHMSPNFPRWQWVSVKTR